MTDFIQMDYCSKRFLIDTLTDICGQPFVFINDNDVSKLSFCVESACTYSEHILVQPGSTDEISKILIFCNKYLIPVTPRAGCTGVVGGTFVKKGGVVISLERLNKIIQLNKVERYVIAEAGVITSDLCTAVETEGLFFPVFPSSYTRSFIGGNVATNAGGIYSCKYGKTSQYVVNLEVVLPTGQVIWTNFNVAKTTTGLNLTQAFVGSEGILGIITKVVLKLLPRPPAETLLLVAFADLKQACDAIARIKQSHLTPSVGELVCKNAIEMTSQFLKKELPLVKTWTEAHLLVGFHDNCAEGVAESMNIARKLLCQDGLSQMLVAESHTEQEQLWELRMKIGEALKSEGGSYRDIDVCLPFADLYDYIMKVEELCEVHNTQFACFGHALDANVHVMLTAQNEKDLISSPVIQTLVESIYEWAISKGGVISGEHGIGLLQRDFMNLQFSDGQLKVMDNIKRMFDPNSILNTGKVIPMSN